MFSVIKNLFDVFFQVCHGFGDHVEVFLFAGFEDMVHMQIPGLAEDRDNWRFRLDKRLDEFVLRTGITRSSGRSEGGNFRRQLPFFDLAEKLVISFICRIRPTAFDKRNAQFTQAFSDAHLIGNGKIDSHSLIAVAQGRVVDGECFFFGHSVFYLVGAGSKPALTLYLVGAGFEPALTILIRIRREADPMLFHH
jgi:hypothetical protein